MNDKLKTYFNKVLSSMPVAVFIFTLIFFMNMRAISLDLKSEFSIEAIDEFIGIYTFYFLRTLALSLLIPLFDVILSTKKLTYRNAVVIHFILINLVVLVLFYQPAAPIISIPMIIGMCSGIYIIIRYFIFYKEKTFTDQVNQLLSIDKE